jgi:hypothetical protein
MKNLLLLIFILLGSLDLHAGTFTSLVNGSWNVAGTWTAVGDSDGIPDIDDDVTIQAIHNVSVTGTGHNCRNLVTNGILTLTSSCNLSIWGNYTLNGSEAGSNGSLSFKSSNGTISGAGTFGSLIRYSFVGSNYTISSEVVILKSIVCSAGNGTITNNGYVRWQRIYGNNSTWINNSGSTLEFGYYIIDSWNVTLNTSAANNTVIYSASSGSHIMKDPVNNTYHHLIFRGSGSTKRMPDDIIVNGTFTLSTNASVDSEGFDLYLRGNFSKPQFSGNITQDPGTVINFDGASAQTITSTGSLTLNDLVFNNPTSVSFLAGLFNISNSMTVSQGTVNLGTALLTLQSNVTKTAYIGQSAGTISGTMTIQRFITARPDGYSDISSPMTSATFASWNDDFNLVFSAYIPNVTEPSCYGYDETMFDYYGIESMTENMVPGVGYEVYFASDGDSTTSLPARTVDVTGTPNMGNISVPVTVNNDGWNLVGNPYASFIDWTHYRTNAGIAINSQFLFYDEAIEDFAAGNPGDVLAPSQGFWIEATSAGNAIFQESNKIVNTSSSFRSRNEQLFAVRVSSDLIRFTSNTYIRFDESADVSYSANHDLTFHQLPNAKAPSLFSHSSDGKNLRINELQPEESFSLPLTFISGIDGTYQISLHHIESAQLEGYNSIILEDKKTGEIIDITNLNYEFEGLVDDDKDRFILHFNKKSTLAIAATSNVSFINSSDGVFVNFNLDELVPAYVTVYNLAGQEIVNTQLVAAEKNKYSIALPESFRGAYIIRVVVGDKIIEQFTQQYFK